MSAAPTIQAVQEVGVAVRVSHYRPIIDRVRECLCQLDRRRVFTRHDLYEVGLDGSAFAPRGGSTAVSLEIDGRFYLGFARCSPRDNFSRQRGRDIALGRAWALAQEDYTAGRLLPDGI